MKGRLSGIVLDVDASAEGDKEVNHVVGVAVAGPVEGRTPLTIFNIHILKVVFAYMFEKHE